MKLEYKGKEFNLVTTKSDGNFNNDFELYEITSEGRRLAATYQERGNTKDYKVALQSTGVLSINFLKIMLISTLPLLTFAENPKLEITQ